MARKRTHGKTASGKPITGEMVAELAEKAEAGYDVEETLCRAAAWPALCALIVDEVGHNPSYPRGRQPDG